MYWIVLLHSLNLKTPLSDSYSFCKVDLGRNKVWTLIKLSETETFFIERSLNSALMFNGLYLLIL